MVGGMGRPFNWQKPPARSARVVPGDDGGRPRCDYVFALNVASSRLSW